MRDKEIFDNAMERFCNAQIASYDTRQQCIRDRRNAHIAGALWEGDWAAYWANKPRMDLNPFTVALNRITAEYNQNRISVDFRPRDGVKNDDLSEALDGLFRADEQDSPGGGGEAYDNAFSEGIAGGIGAWRLRAEYEDEYDPEDDYQRIRIEPIFDADINVIWDPGAKRYDKSDARRCWVLSAMPLRTFTDMYPDHAPSSWPRDNYSELFDWYRVTDVIVAEYYEVVEKAERFAYYMSLTGEETRVLWSDDEKRAELEATGSRFVKERRIKSRRVHKYLMSGSGIIEDCGLIAGKNIPVVPFYARRFWIDGIERCEGHIRHSIDAARVKNMAASRIAEIASLSPYRKPIVSPEQIKGHELTWANDHVDNNPFLVLNSSIGPNGEKVPSAPAGYVEPPDVPPAIAGLVQLASTDMDTLLGNAQAGEQTQANVSAKAVELAGSNRDMRYQVYLDNFAKSMRRAGEIWLSMAQEVYVEEGRHMKTISEQGETANITLMQPYMRDGEQVLNNDLTTANMEVVVDVGPAFASRRDATVRALVGMLQVAQADPQVSNVLLSAALAQMEGEGLKDIRDWFRKRLLAIGAAKPTPEEEQELAAAAEANSQPDPQQVAVMAYAEREMADAAEARANTVRTIEDGKLKQAQTQRTEAETVKILKETMNGAVAQ